MNKTFQTNRPLLNVQRFEIRQFILFWKLPIYPDQSNEQTNLLRNKIRKQLMPTLRILFNPQIDRALTNFTEITKDEQLYFVAILSSLLETKKNYPSFVFFADLCNAVRSKPFATYTLLSVQKKRDGVPSKGLVGKPPGYSCFATLVLLSLLALLSFGSSKQEGTCFPLLLYYPLDQVSPCFACYCANLNYLNEVVQVVNNQPPTSSFALKVKASSKLPSSFAREAAKTKKKQTARSLLPKAKKENKQIRQPTLASYAFCLLKSKIVTFFAFPKGQHESANYLNEVVQVSNLPLFGNNTTYPLLFFSFSCATSLSPVAYWNEVAYYVTPKFLVSPCSCCPCYARCLLRKHNKGKATKMMDNTKSRMEISTIKGKVQESTATKETKNEKENKVIRNQILYSLIVKNSTVNTLNSYPLVFKRRALKQFLKTFTQVENALIEWNKKRLTQLLIMDSIKKLLTQKEKKAFLLLLSKVFQRHSILTDKFTSRVKQ